MTSPQGDLFGHPDPLVGLCVELDRSCCHGNVVEIGPGAGPHGHSLVCPICGGHCGWLSKTAGAFVLETIRVIGVPREPLILRERRG
jgi:hypothetical protein